MSICVEKIMKEFIPEYISVVIPGLSDILLCLKELSMMMEMFYIYIVYSSTSNVASVTEEVDFKFNFN